MSRSVMGEVKGGCRRRVEVECAPCAWLTLAVGEVAGARCGLLNR